MVVVRASLGLGLSESTDLSDFSQSDLQSLWVQAGGDSAVAPLMSAIAMAESGGNPQATNSSSGACGLWQIHPCQNGAYDPMTNAQMAVGKYNSQGLAAWSAYTNGAYKQYYNGGTTSSNSLFSSSSGSSQSGNCQFPSIMGNCPDQFIGIGAMIAGIGLIAGVIMVIIMNTKEFQGTVKLGAQVATLVAK